MVAEYVCCSLTSQKKCTLMTANQKRWTLMTACYEIVKRTYDFVMTYVENCTINMTLVMLFLVGNTAKYNYLII